MISRCGCLLTFDSFLFLAVRPGGFTLRFPVRSGFNFRIDFFCKWHQFRCTDDVADMLFSAAVRRERTNAFGNHIHNPFMQCDFSTTSFSKMCQISNSGLTVILRFAGIIVNLFRETSKPPPALLPMKLRSGSLRSFPAAGRNEIRYILCRTQMQSSSAFRSERFPQSRSSCAQTFARESAV